MKLSVKRVYEKPHPEDGMRVLVDRLWPRGIAKEDANIDLWLKSIAPTNDLRKWYRHEPEKWDEFKKRYFAELDINQDVVHELTGYLEKGPVTLLYSSRELYRNNAVALKEYLNK